MSAWQLPIYSSNIQLRLLLSQKGFWDCPRVSLILTACLPMVVLTSVCCSRLPFLSRTQHEGRMKAGGALPARQSPVLSLVLCTKLALCGVGDLGSSEVEQKPALQTDFPNWVIVLYCVSLYSVVKKPKRDSWWCAGNCSAHKLHNSRQENELLKCKSDCIIPLV